MTADFNPLFSTALEREEYERQAYRRCEFETGQALMEHRINQQQRLDAAMQRRMTKPRLMIGGVWHDADFLLPDGRRVKECDAFDPNVTVALPEPAAMQQPHSDPRRAIKQPRGGCDAPANGGSQGGCSLPGSNTPSPPEHKGSGVARAVAQLGRRDWMMGSWRWVP